MTGNVEPESPEGVAALKARFMKLHNESPDTLDDFWENQLTQEDRAHLLGGSTLVRRWWEVRNARSILDRHGEFGLYQYYKARDDEEARNVITNDKALYGKLQEAVKFLHWFLDPDTSEGERLRKFGALSEEDREQLRGADPRYEEWYASHRPA